MSNTKEENVNEMLAELRTKIRRFRGGMQTHEVQDLQVEVIRHIDNLEVELRPKK